MKPNFHRTTFRIDDDIWAAEFSESGLRRLCFPGRFDRSDMISASVPASSKVQSWMQLTHQWLVNYLQGYHPSKCMEPRLDLDQGTPFQQSVWKALYQIPFGKTSSYGEISVVIGRPKAFRATGSACGANPIPLIIPCHRILAANRKLGGFSGGLEWKKRLLNLEGIEL